MNRREKMVDDVIKAVLTTAIARPAEEQRQKAMQARGEMEKNMTLTGNELDRLERAKVGLEAAIRAAKLGLFTINKQGVMPNDSWKSGFDKDIQAAEDALIALKQELRQP
jgi:hypothetical protein